jgi:hypothetical protein
MPENVHTAFNRKKVAKLMASWWRQYVSILNLNFAQLLICYHYIQLRDQSRRSKERVYDENNVAAVVAAVFKVGRTEEFIQFANDFVRSQRKTAASQRKTADSQRKAADSNLKAADYFLKAADSNLKAADSLEGMMRLLNFSLDEHPSTTTSGAAALVKKLKLPKRPQDTHADRSDRPKRRRTTKEL